MSHPPRAEYSELNSPTEPACCSLLLLAGSPAMLHVGSFKPVSQGPSSVKQVLLAAVLLTMSQLLADLHCQVRQHSPSDAAFATLEPWTCFKGSSMKTRPVLWQRLRHNRKT
jgi:hypothetical protein